MRATISRCIYSHGDDTAANTESLLYPRVMLRFLVELAMP